MAWTDDLRRVFAQDFGPRLCHVTDAETLEALLRDGLRPGMPSQFDGHLLREGVVYLCRRDVAASNLNGYDDSQWGDCAVSVELAALDAGRFVADEDYYRGMPQTIGHPAAAEILAIVPGIDEPAAVDAQMRDPGGGRVGYRGAIPGGLLRVERVDPHRLDVRGLDRLRPAADWPEMRCRQARCPLHPAVPKSRARTAMGARGAWAVERSLRGAVARLDGRPSE